MSTRAYIVAVVLVSTFGSAACRRPEPASKPAPDEPPTTSVTDWTGTTELFMEHPFLVAGQTALFAVHLTRLADFAPVADGHAVIELTPDQGGAPVRLVGSGPSRPGAFRIEAAAPSAGRYRWALLLEGGPITDRHDLGPITVFADEAAARTAAAADAADDPTAIAYLKEQQWTNPFATVIVSDGTVRSSVRVPATVHPLPGGEAIVAAPAAGRLVADVLPSIGYRVGAGHVLARLEPRLTGGPDRATLEAELANTRAATDAAQIEVTRAERLLADRAVPARRVEEARRALLVAQAHRDAAQARLSQREETLGSGGSSATGNAYLLRAPIAGRVAEVMATLGAAYEEGAPLFRIVRTDRVELDVQVSPPDVALARRTVGVALEMPGLTAPIELAPHRVHDSGVIDQRTAALSMQMEVPNTGERLLIGQVGTAVLYVPDRTTMPIVPDAAILREAGRPYVFVQLGGEQFVRRFIEIGARDGDRVGVRAGVSAGERVVTRGSYDIQLASAAMGLPAEGHVH